MTNDNADGYQQITFQDETGITLSDGAKIVDDARFGRCAHLATTAPRCCLKKAETPPPFCNIG